MYFLLAQDPTDRAWEVAVAEINTYDMAVTIRTQEEEWEQTHPESVKFNYWIVEKSIRE